MWHLQCCGDLLVIVLSCCQSIGVAENDVHFLHGLLEGIARIELESYDLLTKLGATPVCKVRLLLDQRKRCLATVVAGAAGNLIRFMD